MLQSRFSTTSLDSPQLKQALRNSLADYLLHILPLAQLSSFLSALGIFWFLSRAHGMGMLGLWLVSVSLVIASWYALTRSNAKHKGQAHSFSRAWHLIFVAFISAGFGLILIFYFPVLSSFNQLLLVAFMISFMMSGVFIFTMIPVMSLVWATPLSFAFYITILSLKERHLVTLLPFTLFIVYLGLVSRDYYRLYRERALFQLKAEYHKEELVTLFKQSPVSIFLTDLDGNILHVNQKMEELSGFSKEQLIGKNPRILKSGKTDPAVHENLWQTITSGDTWVGEFINCTCDGREYTEKASISPIKDPSGSIINYLAIKEDVTLQHDYEKKLEHQNSIIQLLLRDFEDQAGDWLWEMDLENTITYLSEKFLKNFQGEQVLGQSIFTFVKERLPRGDYEAEQQFLLLAQGLHNAKALNDFELKLQINGTIHWLMISAIPKVSIESQTLGWRGVGRDITDKKLLEIQLYRKANFDELSGLINRSNFKDTLDDIISKWSGDLNGILGIIKLENLDVIRVNLGSRARNELLRAFIAEIYVQLGSSIVLARLEKDEFAFWMADSDIDKVATIHSLVHRFEKPFLVGTESFLVDMHIGIAFFPEDAGERGDLFRAADLALNNARDSSTRKVMRYRKNLATDYIRKLKMVNEFNSALDAGQFIMHYQPQLDAKTGSLVGAEALIRWNHPVNGTISPGEFIPLAEQSGFITTMGEWTLTQVCSDAVKWEKPLQVSINVSGVQLRDSRRVLHAVTVALDMSGLDPERLILEITESAMFGGKDEVVASLSKLRDLGIKIALDDFGTGYSSLAYIQSLHLDKLKIDQSFVKKLGAEKDAEKFISIILDLANSMKLETVAEGVETEEQAAILKRYSCNWLQGYLYGKAMPQEEFRERIFKEISMEKV